jgi:hypothetical protein
MLTEDRYNNIKNRRKIIRQILLPIDVLSMVLEITFFTNLGIITLVGYSVIIINQQYRVYGASR